LDFSPDGSSYAFVDGPRLNFNGTILAGHVSGTQYIFSPDGKHLAYLGNDGSGTVLFLDGKIIDSPPTAGQISRVFFSPDSQHLHTLRRQGFPGSKDRIALSVDGQMAVHYMEDNNFGGYNGGNFEFGVGSELSFMNRTDGNLRLFHVTPGDSSLQTLLASAKVPQDKP
jgi:hypothetical protein